MKLKPKVVSGSRTGHVAPVEMGQAGRWHHALQSACQTRHLRNHSPKQLAWEQREFSDSSPVLATGSRQPGGLADSVSSVYNPLDTATQMGSSHGAPPD